MNDQSTNYNATPNNISTVQSQQAEDKLASAKSPAFQYTVSVTLGVLTIILLSAVYYYGVAR